MHMRGTEEAKRNVEEFTKRLIKLQQDKKNIDADIKALKDEYKEEGVPVGIVTKVINVIKANKKKTDAAKFEEEAIQEWLEANKEIDNQIGMLGAK